MAGEHEENGYREELHKVFKKMEPASVDYDRILQSVLSAVGKPGAANYADAEARVNHLSNYRIVHMVKQVIVSKTGASIIAAGLLLTIFISFSMFGDTAVVIPENDVPMSGGPSMGDAPVQESRKYSISGPVAVYKDSSSLEDGPVPTVESWQVEGNLLFIYLNDNGAGIAWDKIYVRDLSGESFQPVEINAEQMRIGFALPTDSFEIYLEDQGGMRSVISVIAD